ncbi:hypothetical protein Q0F98_23315 [Paenibacillus amylolyticus]|nr:hypothetical protein Q0F98_23315 [Paenibacillus amylolyticus]
MSKKGTDEKIEGLTDKVSLCNHRKLYTLMYDAMYRVGIAGQNSGYNQPSYPSFYMASDID